MDGAFFLCPRLDTVPAVVLLVSEEVFELFALRVLRLLAMGISGKVPTTGVAVFDVRPVRVIVGAGIGVSTSIASGSSGSISSCFKVVADSDS
jgi:hypothetical protein